MAERSAFVEAEALLWRHYEAGTRMPELPPGLRPSTRQEGYAIQALLMKRSKRPLYGWKIAATSLAGQKHIGVDGPLAGRILADRVREDGATLELGPNHMKVVEPEFAFRMGRTLAPRTEPFTGEEVLEAVDALHVALEIPDSRFDDYARVGAPQLIADNACAREFLLGPRAPLSWRSLDLAGHPVEGKVEGRLVRDGKGSNVLGDPRIALAWLANELSRLGIPLATGEVVTTGTCMVPLAVEAGDRVTADFGVLGTVSLCFGPR